MLESELWVPGSSQVDALRSRCQMLNDCCTGSWSESIRMDRMKYRGPVGPIPKEWQFGLQQALELANSNQDKFLWELGEVFTVMVRHLLSVRANQGQQEAPT